MFADSRKLSMNMKLIIFCIIFIVFAISAHAQTADCPPAFICLTQAEANRAAENARELVAQKEKVKVLESALSEKDKSIAELKSLNDKNTADLKEAIRRTEIELATRTGQLISAENELTRQTAIIQALLPMVRKKRIALITIF